MKKISIYSFILIALSFMLWSCEKDLSENPTLNISTVPVISTPSGEQTIVIIAENAATPFSVEWSAANFGFDAEITYQVQMAPVGTNFAELGVIGAVTEGRTSFVTNYDVLNATALSLGLLPDVETTVEMRVVGIVAEKAPQAISSNVVTINLTPYFTFPSFKSLYVPGSHSSWDPPTSQDSIVALDPNNRNDADVGEAFEGFVYFPDAAEFKLTPRRNWDKDFCDGGSNALDVGCSTNLSVPGEGYYQIKANTENLTFSIKQTNSWSIIGDATPGGWGSDTPLTFDPVTKLWTAEVALVPGPFKFRADGDWAFNYGDNVDNNGALFPSLDEGSDQNIINDKEGTYTVTLDLTLKSGFYTYTIE